MLLVELPHKVVKSKKKTQSEIEGKLQELHSLMTEPQQLSIFCLKDTVISIEDVSLSLWDRVYAHMEASYSKVRNHGPAFLVYAILDSVVNEMLPLIQIFDVKLKLLEKLLHINSRKFDQKRLTRTKKQLICIQKIVRPILDNVHQLLDADEFMVKFLTSTIVKISG